VNEIDQANAGMGRPWMSVVLVIAGIYNLIFGAWSVLFPESAFILLGMNPPEYLFLWQCIGMIVGVYGIGYLAAARNPLRHWPIILVGFLGKILGPIGFLQTAIAGDIPWSFGWLLITNDLIWWIPFAGILLAALGARRRTEAG
jgi:small multidrug resistance pump